MLIAMPTPQTKKANPFFDIPASQHPHVQLRFFSHFMWQLRRGNIHIVDALPLILRRPGHKTHVEQGLSVSANPQASFHLGFCFSTLCAKDVEDFIVYPGAEAVLTHLDYICKKREALA
jgi:hypothetical protein